MGGTLDDVGALGDKPRYSISINQKRKERDRSKKVEAWKRSFSIHLGTTQSHGIDLEKQHANIIDLPLKIHGIRF